MRLIDVEDVALMKTVSDGGLSAKALWRRICKQPTIDAVPVIRCKDCVEFRRWDDECGECCDGLADGAMVRADGYCYAAERKTE